jgi:hypothetical protein
MPQEVERERAEYQGELVTVLERRRSKSTIRTSTGFVREVSTDELVSLPDTDDRKTFQAVTDSP